MCVRLGLDPLLSHRDESIYIFSKGFWVSVSKVTGDVIEEVLGEGGKGIGSFWWDGEEVGLEWFGLADDKGGDKYVLTMVKCILPAESTNCRVR